MNNLKHRFLIGLGLVSLAAFLFLGVVTAYTIYLSFRPAVAAATAVETGGAGAVEGGGAVGAGPGRTPNLIEKLAGFFMADRSGASAACVAIFALALARFLQMKATLGLHLRWLASGGAVDVALPAADPLMRFAAEARADKRAALERLDMRMMAEYDLHPYVSRMVTLGLFGTLIGLWIGFVQTLAPGMAAQDGLQRALAQAVIVVATAALSSISGIGIGQLLLQPLAEHIDRQVQRVVEEAGMGRG